MVNAATIVSSAVSFVLPKAWCGVRTHVVMNSLKKMHCQVLREELCCDIVICNAFSFPSCIFLSSFAPLSEWQQQYFFFFCCGSQLPGATFVTGTKTLLCNAISCVPQIQLLWNTLCTGASQLLWKLLSSSHVFDCVFSIWCFVE